MADAVADLVRRYILDGSDQDLRRLLSVAQVSAEMARAAFARVGVHAGSECDRLRVRSNRRARGHGGDAGAARTDCWRRFQ